MGYTAYVNNFDNAVAQIAKLKQTIPKFKQILEKGEKNPKCHLQDLPSLMLNPIQRIPRYSLLLKDLIKRSYPGRDPTAIDFTELDLGLQKIQEIAHFINESKRDSEDWAYMEKLDILIKKKSEKGASLVRDQYPLADMSDSERE